MKLFQIAQWILTQFHQEKERIEENQLGKVAPEKKVKKGKRKNLGLSNKKNPHQNDGGFVLKAGLEPARILLSIGF